MIIYFDTLRRKRPIEKGGELVKLDWTTKKVEKRIPIYPTDPDITHDPNPRGNSRGGKGILVAGDEVFVGTYHTILVFDLDLKLKRKISSNLFVNIHEMCFAGRNIWVSSTTIDCAILVNREGETIKTWWPREEPVLQEKFGLRPLAIDKQADNRLRYIHAELGNKEGHTHLNSVTQWNSQTYVLLNRLGVVVRIEPDVKVVLEDKLLKGAHSPVVCADGKRLLLCSSFNKCVLVYDIESGNLLKEINLLDFEEVVRLHKKYPDQPFNKSIFVRGLDIIKRSATAADDAVKRDSSKEKLNGKTRFSSNSSMDGDRILVGISPASILEIDISRNRLLDFYRYSSDVGDAVHGLASYNE